MLTRIKTWFTKTRLESTPFYERTVYSFDGLTLRASDPLGADQALDLAEVSDVGVETTCLGPFVEDVFWVVSNGSEKIRVPQCSPIFKKLLAHFETLEGFDWESFGRSVPCTDDAYFPCWSRNVRSELKRPNKAPEPTPGSVTPRATSR